MPNRLNPDQVSTLFGPDLGENFFFLKDVYEPQRLYKKEYDRSGHKADRCYIRKP